MTAFAPWRPEEDLGVLPRYSEAERALERPREALRLNDESGAALACCALWTSDEMRDPDGVAVARIGRYAAVDKEAGARLLRHACTRLSALSAKRVVGPMNGSTWHTYRLVTDFGKAPRMPLEPWTTFEEVAAFEAAGFAPCAEYVSVETEALASRDDAETAAREASKAGVTLRPLSVDRFDAELRVMYAVSAAAFVNAAYSSTLSVDEFLTLYRPVKPFSEPRFITLAERDGACVGFIFCFRHPGAPSLILKTLAVDPDLHGADVGKALTLRAMAAAREAGLSSVIFATMHASILSASWASERGRIIRRYALFGRDL